MQRQRLKFLTSVGVTPQPLHDQQQQQERESKRERLNALLSEDRVDMAALRAAIADGALFGGPERGNDSEEGELDLSDGEATRQREDAAGKEKAAIQKLRGLSWKLLLGALPVYRKERKFFRDQQHEWYADLSKAAETLCKSSPSPALCTSSLSFTLQEAGMDEQRQQIMAATISRLLRTLDLKQLASCSPADPSSAVLWSDHSYSGMMHIGGGNARDPGSVDMCRPLTAGALPSAELDSIAYHCGQRPIFSEEEKLEWRAETFDMATIAVRATALRVRVLLVCVHAYTRASFP